MATGKAGGQKEKRPETEPTTDGTRRSGREVGGVFRLQAEDILSHREDARIPAVNTSVRRTETARGETHGHTDCDRSLWKANEVQNGEGCIARYSSPATAVILDTACAAAQALSYGTKRRRQL